MIAAVDWFEWDLSKPVISAACEMMGHTLKRRDGSVARNSSS
jgi:hypothetical protein